MNSKFILTIIVSLFAFSLIAKEKADKEIKVSEIVKHKTEKSCWMVINKSVYDLTEYIPLHEIHAPKEMLTAYCGKDASKAFKTKGSDKDHTQNAYNLLEKYKIGILKIPKGKKNK